ncbi:hypothetical protein F5Y03DRAFT_410525 [Xylaria venustula]|nr:hypothetical protein F5Y03DRAFT_410525 [Xylaria venustula]
MPLSHLLTLIVSALAIQAAATVTAPTDSALDLNTTHINTCQEITPGTPCAGSEGLWNCMGTSFQRCGSGRWSAVQSCALGTRCKPVGLTFQFHVNFADGSTTPSPTLAPTPFPTTTTTTAATSSAERGGVGSLSGLLVVCGLGVMLVFVLAL